MKTYQALGLSGILAMGLGCGKTEKLVNHQTSENTLPYVSEVPSWDKAGVSVAVGDFNGDGHLDYLVTSICAAFVDIWQSSAKTYLFLGDGKRNFTKK